MQIMDYTIELDGLINHLRDLGWKHIGLQFPEGVKPYARKIIRDLESGLDDRNIKFTVSGTPCFGACDVADIELSMAGADGLVHFGHSSIPKIEDSLRLPVIFQEMRSERDILPVVKMTVDSGLLKGRVALVSTVQHVHLLPDAKKLLAENGMDARIGTGGKRLAYPGQVLGCSFSSAATVHDADVTLFIGEGIFHPLGIRLATGKPVIAADPRTCKIRDMEEEKDQLLRQRFAAIQKLKNTKEIGIVVSTLPGQMRREYASALERLGKENGKDMMVISVQHLNIESLNDLGMNLIVSTACPRVALDDYSLFLENGITITTPIEFLIALGMMKWDNYLFDSIE